MIDPSRRTDQIKKLAANANLTIKGIFETHIHKDYITGGFILSKELNVPYYISALEPVQFKAYKIKAQDIITIGQLKITAIASPGHTYSHLSYLIEFDSAVPVLFSGGSLLYGSVGRPDLISAKDTPILAKAQYATAKNYRAKLNHATLLYPTHGFGSFCSSGSTELLSLSQNWRIFSGY